MKIVLDYEVWKEIAHLFEELGGMTKDGGLELDLNAYTTKIEIHGGSEIKKINFGAVIEKKEDSE